MVDSEGSLDLDFPPDAYNEAWIATAVFGFPICALLMGIFTNLYATSTPDSPFTGPVVVGAIGALCAGYLVYRIIRMREPRSARVIWDKKGITEWDGDRVRAMIPWSAARRFVLEIKVQYQRRGMNVGAAHSEGFVVQFTGE